MKMRYGSNLGRRRQRPMKTIIHVEQVLQRETVLPADLDRPVAHRLNNRARRLPLVAPQRCRRKPGVQLFRELQHPDTVEVCAAPPAIKFESFEHRKRFKKAFPWGGAPRRSTYAQI